MTKTQVLNTLYALICALAALGAETGTLTFIPEKYRHYVTTASAIALWIKSHYNLGINPDGTAAQSAWEPKK